MVLAAWIQKLAISGRIMAVETFAEALALLSGSQFIIMSTDSR